MEWRTLSSRITSNEGSSKVIVSGGTDVRYVSNGLITLGHIPSASKDEKNQTEVILKCQVWKNEAETALFCYNPKGSFLLTMPEFILFLGIARGGFSGSSLGSTPLSTYSIFAAVLILSHRLIPRGKKSIY